MICESAWPWKGLTSTTYFCSHSCCCPGMRKETCLSPGAQWYWATWCIFEPARFDRRFSGAQKINFLKMKGTDRRRGTAYQICTFQMKLTLREKILDCCKLSGVPLTMCYQVMFAWQWQAMQETLSHVTSKMESIKWTVQILKTSFTFIRSGYLCIRHEVCQPHFSLTNQCCVENFNELILYYVWKTPRWFHKNQVPMKYELLLEASPLT